MPLDVEVIDSNTFPSDFLASKASNSSTATESVSSDNMQPASPQLSPNRMIAPGSPHRSPMMHSSSPYHSPIAHRSPHRSPNVHHNSPHRSPNVYHNSPHRSPGVHNSPMPHGSPSDRGMIHTRTNFGKTRGYVPPMVPSSPARVTVDVPPSPRRLSSNPFEVEDAPDDEARFRTVQSLRPKPVQSLRPKPAQYNSDGSNNKSPYRNGRLHRRHNSATQDVAASSPRPEAYISETDESSMGQHDLSYESRSQRAPSPSRNQRAPSPSQDARQPSPEAPYDIGPTRSQGKEVRHPSPIDTSPIRSATKNQGAIASPKSPTRLTADEIGEIRRRRRLNKSKMQFEMPEPHVVEQDTPMNVTSTKTSDLTDDTALDPVPSFDGNSVVQQVMESELEYHEDSEVLPPPVESPSYEEFEMGREASLSPQKKPKSILRTARYSSAESDLDDDDDDDSLFDFGDDASSLGQGIVRKSSSLKKTGSSGSNRRGRRTRKRSDESSHDDDESLIQYGEHHKRSSSLQERTQEAWTFRSKRSFSATASPSKKENAGVQFGNTDTVHHFDDQETVQTAGTTHSLNSLYTKSPESETEDLIKDLLMIGSGQHSNPGRRKLKYQPVYKRELKEGVDERSADDATLGTTDVSLNTLDYHTGTRGRNATSFTPAKPKTESKEQTSVETSPVKSDALSKQTNDTLVSQGSVKDDSDPLSFVWNYVESGMMALGLASAAGEQKKIKGEEERKDREESYKCIECGMVLDNMANLELHANKTGHSDFEESTQAVKQLTADEETPKEENMAVDLSPEKMQSEEEEEEEVAALTAAATTTTATTPATADVLVLKDTLVAPPSGVRAIDTSGGADDYPDEVKEDAKGSFSEVMDYIFGDPLQKDKGTKKQSLVSSAGSVTTSTTSTRLEDDPRLEELALHAVKSRHQMYDMEYDESFPVNIEKDIKFSLVKMKLPLGILFHENDGGCWITKVFPDGNAAKAGGVEVGDQLAAINGTSAIKLRVDQICTLITEAPDPENMELTFLRYTGQLHPFVPVEAYESFEVTNADALMKPPIKKKPSKTTRALSRLRSPSPKPRRYSQVKEDLQQKPSEVEAKRKTGLGKWFGKGKKKSHAV